MDYRVKVWLEKDGEPLFGDGILHLLTLINRHGSIRRAAEEMKMSYRQAWGNVKKTEDRLGTKLLVKQIGGESGGGAYLTPEAEKLMANYRGFRQEAEEAVRQCFSNHFEP